MQAHRLLQRLAVFHPAVQDMMFCDVA
jgi:hypothetical protein